MQKLSANTLKVGPHGISEKRGEASPPLTPNTGVLKLLVLWSP